MISIICCYNNLKEYNCMVNSLKNQTVKYELIGIDNSFNTYKSAASALNYGASIANGEILVFLHQDIEFLNNNSLFKLTNFLNSESKHIIGIAGASYNKKKYNSDFNIVQTLDECIIAMKKSVFEKYQFDEFICDNWHLYVVELCLRANEKNITSLEMNNDSLILHKSTGNINKQYMKTYIKIMKKYKNVKYISTTCKSMPNNILYFYLYYGVWLIKKGIFGNYPLVSKIKSKLKG